MIPLLKEVKKNSKRNHAEMNESGKRSKILIYIINMTYFALSILLFTLGVLYLTGFSYQYSVTRFSTSVVGGVFVGISIIVFLLSILNVIFMNANRQVLVFASSVLILILFIILFGFGIWGLVASSDEASLAEEIRYDLTETIRRYEERNLDRYETRKMNWIQTKFNCCGIHTYNDWRSFYLYGGQTFGSAYVDQWTVNNNLPYIDHVPDSCCINRMPNCGKQFYNNMNPQALDRDRIIYTRGCLYNFLAYFTKDIMFLSILSSCIASLAMVLWVVLAFVYVIIHVRN
jgi:hypothetical protein